jgi:hypothetical protein
MQTPDKQWNQAIFTSFAPEKWLDQTYIISYMNLAYQKEVA